MKRGMESGSIVFIDNGSVQPDSMPVEISTYARSGTGIPEEYELLQNYPNPFNPSTVIEYGLPVESEVSLTIYNVLGVEVRKFNDGRQGPGYHAITWDGTNDAGEYVSGGVYFYRINATGAEGQEMNYAGMSKMILVK
jgi:hypothetical protein